MLISVEEIIWQAKKKQWPHDRTKNEHIKFYESYENVMTFIKLKGTNMMRTTNNGPCVCAQKYNRLDHTSTFIGLIIYGG